MLRLPAFNLRIPCCPCPLWIHVWAPNVSAMERPKMIKLNFLGFSKASLSSLLFCSASLPLPRLRCALSTQIRRMPQIHWYNDQSSQSALDVHTRTSPGLPLLALISSGWNERHGMGAGIRETDDTAVRSLQDPVKKEGDGKSPAGIFTDQHRLRLRRRSRRGWKTALHQPHTSVECVDDSASHFYNRIVDRASVSPRLAQLRTHVASWRSLPLGSSDRPQRNRSPQRRLLRLHAHLGWPRGRNRRLHACPGVLEQLLS